MIDISSFLMRWLFLCNLIRDVAEIQTLPYTPYSSQQVRLYQLHQHNTNGQSHQTYPYNQDPYHDQEQSVYPQQQQHQHPQPPLPQDVSRQHPEEEWRDHCLRGILSYPPGTQRLLVMDAMRVELVQQLHQYIQNIDSVLQREKLGLRPNLSISSEHIISKNNSSSSDSQDDPYLDSDMEILKTFEHGVVTDEQEEASENVTLKRHQQATLSISPDSTASNMMNEHLILSDGKTVAQKTRALQELREYLPQLVSAVLKSPPPFDPDLIDPVQRLRDLVIHRCQQDPSWGIELCWLLEAEVGRAWKHLFEHRQQTGKRLIVVLPAEKAAVLAKIGTEKREAFDLLQDAERITAYGYAASDELWQEHGSLDEKGHTPARLPSSLSVLRCSHFGDTMHFIDRLSKISLDLRRVPAIERHAHLHDALYEMNRRLRRRMVTRGEVSLDVEDNLGPYDWPQVKELTSDMLKYSVHFPLIPCEGSWPAGGLHGENHAMTSKGGVMQVLNIVVPESRILASRERCPYLVRLEVLETGLEGSDARLYAAGPSRVGATIEESLNMSPVSGPGSNSAKEFEQSCDIPSELINAQERKGNSSSHSSMGFDGGSEKFPRGGWQAYANGTDFVHETPYDMARQQQYEQLHQQMQETSNSLPPQNEVLERPSVTTGIALLDRIYGKPWMEVCDDVRRTSPYGHISGWRLASFIMKAGEDIRREALVMQIISKFRYWFEAEISESHRPYLRPYTIMCVGGDAGLIECLTDAKSIDEVKKKADGFVSLRDYFERAYGPPGYHHQMQQPRQPGVSPGLSDHSRSLTFEEAQDNFLRSLVGYSLVCYVLQIKDRHNANILLDREGHIMHIDFGFVLGDTPKMGKVPIFSERAPFKLSNEFWEVLGGWNVMQGGLGVRFCKIFERAFAVASAHSEEIASLVEGTMLTLSQNPTTARISANRVRSRLRMRGPPNSFEQKMFIMDVVNTALTSWGTSTYDWLQKNMNGYQ